MRCTPSLCDGSRELRPIPGSPPSLLHPPEGDSFAPRNEYALAIDFEKEPPMFSVSATHKAATWLLSEGAGNPEAHQIRFPYFRKTVQRSAEKCRRIRNEVRSSHRHPESYLSISPARKKSVTALDSINLQLFRGEIFGLVGESGSGKSTLARCIMNILNPSEGRIIYDGIDTCGPARHPEAKKMLQGRRSLIFQDSDASFSPRMRVEKIIAEPLQVKRPRPSSGKLRSEAEFQANAAGLSSVYLSRFSSDLSGGQRQRAAIARALITEPEFLAS